MLTSDWCEDVMARWSVTDSVAIASIIDSTGVSRPTAHNLMLGQRCVIVDRICLQRYLEADKAQVHGRSVWTQLRRCRSHLSSPVLGSCKPIKARLMGKCSDSATSSLIASL